MIQSHQASWTSVEGPVVIMITSGPCDGNTLPLNCTVAQYHEGITSYKAGALMQEAFPFLTGDEREFLMSGMLPDEWDSLMRGGR